MENNTSNSLIDLDGDDDLLQFDPLSSSNTSNSQLNLPNDKLFSYSNELLQLNSSKANSDYMHGSVAKPVRRPPPPPPPHNQLPVTSNMVHSVKSKNSVNRASNDPLNFHFPTSQTSPRRSNIKLPAAEKPNQSNKVGNSFVSYLDRVDPSNNKDFFKSQSTFYGNNSQGVDQQNSEARPVQEDLLISSFDDFTNQDSAKTTSKLYGHVSRNNQSPKRKTFSFTSYLDGNNLDEQPELFDSSNIDKSNQPPSRHDIDGKRSGVNQKREELIEVLMQKRQDDFTSTKPFRIFVGTWNVNGQYPPKLVSEWTATDAEAPDMYIIGFQELDLSKEAFVFSESSREEEWLRVVSQSLHPKEKYVLIKLVRLVGMMMLVFSINRHQSHITHIESYQVGTGLLGKMGNKGGVGIRFNLHNTKVCFINSHLAAHLEMTQKRNENFTDICSRMKFPAPDGPGYIHIFQHDLLVWLGDLNYRIDGMLPEMVKECVEYGHFEPLLKNDQLLCERREGRVFQDFVEGDIDFRPTYKYSPGSDAWDSREKCRVPSWCDRVLWWEPKKRKKEKSPGKVLNLRKYRSHHSLKISDHKPVSALFDLNAKVVDEARYRRVFDEECRNLDRMENDSLPSLALSKHMVSHIVERRLDFGTVRFQQSSVQTIELHNTGKRVCEFEFIAKPDESSFCKPWLMIPKPRGFVMPNDKLEVEFEIYINKLTVSDLNCGREKIEDILILHLVGGKDFFITISGSYLPSCFGTSLEALCRMKKPMRQVPMGEIFALSQISASGSNKIPIDLPCSPIPKELWQIMDHLYHHGLREPHLFQRTGLHCDLQAIQETLDIQLCDMKARNSLHSGHQIHLFPYQQPHLFQRTGLHCDLQAIQETLDIQLCDMKARNSLPGSNHSVAESLLVFLEVLPEPVIPFAFYAKCLELSSDYAKSKQMLKSMSVCHLNVFNYLISFLQQAIKHQSHNELNVPTVASIFSGLLLRPRQRKSGIEARIDRERAKTFLETFLQKAS